MAGSSSKLTASLAQIVLLLIVLGANFYKSVLILFEKGIVTVVCRRLGGSTEGQQYKHVTYITVRQLSKSLPGCKVWEAGC